MNNQVGLQMQRSGQGRGSASELNFCVGVGYTIFLNAPNFNHALRFIIEEKTSWMFGLRADWDLGGILQDFS